MTEPGTGGELLVYAILRERLEDAFEWPGPLLGFRLATREPERDVEEPRSSSTNGFDSCLEGALAEVDGEVVAYLLLVPLLAGDGEGVRAPAPVDLET